LALKMLTLAMEFSRCSESLIAPPRVVPGQKNVAGPRASDSLPRTRF
jgi:hypothetical protein